MENKSLNFKLLEDTALADISFKTKSRPDVDEISRYIDRLKSDLFDPKWSDNIKK